MKKTLFLGMIVTSSLSILSCNKQSEESQLYIVDSIKLGSSKRDFELHVNDNITRYDRRKPGREFFGLQFLTKPFLNKDEISKHLLFCHYTLTFNTNDNTDSSGWSDYGVIIPQYNTTNNHLLGVTILFGRTTGAFVLGTDDIPPAFIQANRKEYIQRIKNMLVKKYGDPTKITMEEGTPIYAFKENQMEVYGTNKDSKGELLEWENDIVKITLFTGIDYYNFTYNQTTDSYFIMSEEFSKSKEIDKDTEITKGYAYIKYELKEDYIEKKKLDIPNL